MGELRNEFSLSFSTAKLLNSCARAWYWKAYGSWNGWNDGAPESARLAYALKQGQTIDMLVGKLVHRVAYDLIQAAARHQRGPLEEREYTIGKAGAELAKALNDSELGLWKTQAKRKPVLLDWFYQAPELPERMAIAQDKLRTCLDHLFVNPRAINLSRTLADGTAKLIAAEHLEGFGLKLDDGEPVKIWVQFDLAVRHEPTRRLVIFDWKTGRPYGENDAQVGIYAMWLETTDILHAGRISLAQVYLGQNEERILHSTDEIRAQATEYLKAALAKATFYLVAADRQANQAVPMERFEQVGANQPECRRCAYRRLCERG
jgi:hypothetical protein